MGRPKLQYKETVKAKRDAIYKQQSRARLKQAAEEKRKADAEEMRYRAQEAHRQAEEIRLKEAKDTFHHYTTKVDRIWTEYYNRWPATTPPSLPPFQCRNINQYTNSTAVKEKEPIFVHGAANDDANATKQDSSLTRSCIISGRDSEQVDAAFTLVGMSCGDCGQSS